KSAQSQLALGACQTAAAITPTKAIARSVRISLLGRSFCMEGAWSPPSVEPRHWTFALGGRFLRPVGQLATAARAMKLDAVRAAGKRPGPPGQYLADPANSDSGGTDGVGVGPKNAKGRHRRPLQKLVQHRSGAALHR